jgi:hypothetical protein
MKTHLILAASLLAVPSAWPQAPAGQPAQYMQVACLKRAPGATNQAVENFYEDYELKRMQYRVKAGVILRWRLERNVLPGGADAGCQFRSVTAYSGFPPEETSDTYAESLRAAGIPFAVPEYNAKRNSVVQLVRLDIFRAEAQTGAGLQKGAYLVATMAKSKPGQRAAFRKEIKDTLLPYYSEMVKNGSIAAAFVGINPLAGPDAPYDTYVSRIHREWKELGNDFVSAAAWQKAHPGKDYWQVMGKVGEIAPVTARNVYRIQMITAPAAESPRTSSGR